MKKLIFIFVIAFTLLTLNANATCPTGWTSANFSYLYDSNGDGNSDCPITVFYCYIVQPTGVLDYMVDEVKVKIPCGISLLGEVNFWGDLNLKLLYDLTNKGTFPPCPLSAYNVRTLRARCFRIINDPGHSQVIAVNCGYTAYCEWKYKICWDTLLNRNVFTFLEVNTIGTPDCSGEMPQLPPAGKTWEDEWNTECYGITCP
jgi:hypothetical protein